MFLNYLKQAGRSLLKGKQYSFLNIIGLSASLTCFAFIALWVHDELSYDKFNKNYNRIYRVVGLQKTETGTSGSAVTSAPMAKALKNDYAEVENTVRLRMREEIITHHHQQVLQPGILLADPSFFNVFSYRLTSGNAATALNEPYSVVLTESTAKKYFGDKDPMGQTLLLNMYDSTGYGATYTVTGIMPDPPQNAHFTFNMLASFKTIEVANPDVLTVDGWGDASFYTYVLLKPGVDYRAFSAKITQFYGKYVGELFNIWKNIYFYRLQPLRDIHLRSRLQYEIAPTGSITNVYIFSTIGIFILLLAAINYMNLATARALSRAKEVSIKKVVGASRNQLVLQYVLEAVLTAFAAFVFSLVFCVLLKPLFVAITAKDLSPLSAPVLLLFLAGVAVLLGLLSGLYPALVISGFRPIGLLKGAFGSGSKGVLLRKALVTVQFVITLVLVAGIVVIHSQMDYIQHKDLGYNKDGLIYLRVNGNTDVIKGYESFRNALAANPLVKGITTSNSLIVSGLETGGAQTVDAGGNPLQVNTARLRVDSNYLKVYGIKLLAGNVFKSAFIGDSIRPIILNASAVRTFGWKAPENAIGKPFTMGTQKGQVIGVVQDFHFNSLHEGIQPLAIYPLENHFSRITVRVDVSDAGRSVALLNATWKKLFPSALFDYDFLDKQIWARYQDEQRFSKIFSCFSLLSLLIACLGLYGLIAYAASRRIKEIGIRKVLGASVRGIVVLLCKDFMKLVLLAFLIAVPIARYALNGWLQDFAYRINIGWWMFAVAGALVLLVAVLTVSFQAIRAALANPVQNLRTE
ncbi:MAG: ABC transporter permease [Flavisolibacter sp.]|nr:ABC transporter permease [Flavisolibacter sp.]